MSGLRRFLIEYHPHTLNVIEHIGISDVMMDGKIKGIGKQQIIYLIHDAEKRFHGQIIFADKGQINIRAGLETADGAPKRIEYAKWRILTDRISWVFRSYEGFQPFEQPIKLRSVMFTN